MEGKKMKFFVDTANVEDIKKANDMGVICGVTTNPSLIAKEGRDFNEVIKEITSIASYHFHYNLYVRLLFPTVHTPKYITSARPVRLAERSVPKHEASGIDSLYQPHADSQADRLH